MNRETTRYFKSIEKTFGQASSAQLYSFIQETSKEVSNQVVNDQTKGLATSTALGLSVTELKLAIAELKEHIAKSNTNNLKWNILFWLTQLGLLAGLFEYLKP